MPGKKGRSAPRPTFGLPKMPVAIHIHVRVAGKPEKREYSHQFGSYPGNPGYDRAPQRE